MTMLGADVVCIGSESDGGGQRGELQRGVAAVAVRYEAEDHGIGGEVFDRGGQLDVLVDDSA